MRRRIGKILILLTGLAGLGGLGYGLLPWYLPKGIIKDKLCAQLQRELGRQVSMGELKLSWAEGVEIRDLVIKRRRGFGPGELARIKRLWCPFAPVRLLRTGPTELLLEGADIFVVVTPEDINISDLPELEMAQVKIRQGVLHMVSLPRGQDSKEAVFDINFCEIFKKPQWAGGIMWRADLQQQDSRGKFFCTGQLGVAGEQEKVTVRAEELALEQLGLEPWINFWLSKGQETDQTNGGQVMMKHVEGKCSFEAGLVFADEGGSARKDRWDKIRHVKLEGAGLWRGNRQDKQVTVEAKGIELTPSRWLIPQITVGVGDNQVTLIAEVNNPIIGGEQQETTGPTGTINLVGEKIDLDELGIWARKANIKPEGGSETRQVKEQMEKILKWARRGNLQGSCVLGRLSYTDAKTEARVDLDEWRSNYELKGGEFDLHFQAGLAGGTVNGKVRSDLRADDAVVWYEQTVREIEATEKLRPLVESEFPGMKVSGRISEKKELQSTLGRLWEDIECWQGSGTTTCSEGVVFGPGGPEWMLRVFPGLELVEYNWREMTNEFELLPDGGKKNRMLFTGEVYNIYIDGISRAVREPKKYDEVIGALEKDVQQSREQGAAPGRSEMKMSEANTRYLCEQAAGWERLWQRHQAGEKLRVTEADYEIGGLLSRKGKGLFSPPQEILRIPIFLSHSYVVGHYMVEMKTKSLPFYQKAQDE